jgi:hypothetical protein
MFCCIYCCDNGECLCNLAAHQKPLVAGWCGDGIRVFVMLAGVLVFVWLAKTWIEQRQMTREEISLMREEKGKSICMRGYIQSRTIYTTMLTKYC